jgi:nitrite reductase (NADH) large subunit
MRYLIVGGSIAGLSCARKIRELETDSEIIILSEEERPYAKMALPYVLSGEMKTGTIWLEVPNDVQFLTQKKVTKVAPGERKVITEQAEEFGFDKLLIACGARAATPEFEGSTSPFVFTIRNLSDILGLKARLEKAPQARIIISGAGPVSMEMAEGLRKLGYQPILVASSHKVLSTILDDGGSDVLKQDLLEKGVDIYFGENIRRVKTGEKEVLIETGSGKEFKGDLLIVGKGSSPNTDLLISSGIGVENGVIVDAFLETTRKGIFAAGDVCQAYDIVRKEKRVNALWPIAVEQGKYAAMNMTRSNIPYKGSVGRNIVTAFGNTVFTAGLSRSTDLETYCRAERNKYSKVILRDGRLVGVIFINVDINPGAYLVAIEKEAEVSGLKQVLLSGSLSYSHLWPFAKPAFSTYEPKTSFRV